ncbi:hypothetical protein E0U70_09120 [Salmonella enterica subsp. enterica serovar Gloucester]|nr:hypothetical protein [Salmonella enterica subsp. enterica serovar Gloucester]
MYAFIILIIVAIAFIIFLKIKTTPTEDTHTRIRNEASNKIAYEEAENARRHDARKAAVKKASPLTESVEAELSYASNEAEGLLQAPKWWVWPNDEIPAWAEVIEVDATVLMKNLHRRGSDVLIHVNKYSPTLSIFRGVVVNGEFAGLPIEVNLDYEKYAIHPDTGERIPGIKRYLRQNAIEH